ncbi:MAG: HAD family phosphatase [Calditrichaeota bacterium]|nr:HAD family phosphatase [Calditrichota bacterium]RQV92524.1 MAG: HAD family phosphatase [bacterium]
MKAILFDFDGVLVQSMEDHFEGWRRALEKYGIEMKPEDLYMMEGQGVRGVANEITRKYQLTVDETHDIITNKQKYYEEIKKIRFYPNLLNVLDWAQEKSLKLAVVTGGNRSRVMETLENFGLTDYFQAIITSDDVSETKPSPQPYLQAAISLQVSPEDCVVVENAPLGIRSGKSAGMHVIGITTTLNSFHLKNADIVVNDFHELLEALKKMY